MIGIRLQPICAMFLIYLAVKIARHPAPTIPARTEGSENKKTSLIASYSVGLFWTLSGPSALLGFAAVTPHALDLGAATWVAVICLAGCVLVASATWWTALVIVVALGRHELTPSKLRLANLTTATSLGVPVLLILTQTVKLAAQTQDATLL